MLSTVLSVCVLSLLSVVVLGTVFVVVMLFLSSVVVLSTVLSVCVLSLSSVVVHWVLSNSLCCSVRDSVVVCFRDVLLLAIEL